LAALEDVIVRFSQLVAELRAIKEIDVNPLLVSPGEILALDARVILHDAAVTESQLPPLAIRPYPQHYGTVYTLADRTPILVRAIRPEDEPMMVRFHGTLSDESVYFRYFTHVTLEQRISHARLARLCFIDYDREIALVAVQAEPLGGVNAIIGVARLCKPHGAGDAEFAVVVSDGCQRRGVGTRLLRKLLEVAREEHVTRIRGVILHENHAMRRLCQRVGFDVHQRPDEADYEAVWHDALNP
jgi:acetyltransferase